MPYLLLLYTAVFTHVVYLPQKQFYTTTKCFVILLALERKVMPLPATAVHVHVNTSTMTCSLPLQNHKSICRFP